MLTVLSQDLLYHVLYCNMISGAETPSSAFIRSLYIDFCMTSLCCNIVQHDRCQHFGHQHEISFVDQFICCRYPDVILYVCSQFSLLCDIIIV